MRITIVQRQTTNGSGTPTTATTSSSSLPLPTSSLFSSSSPSSAGSSPAVQSPSSEKPFFPVPTGIVQKNPVTDDKNHTAKKALEWLFVGFGILLLVTIALRRCNKLRNERIPLSHFFYRRKNYRRRGSRGLLMPETAEVGQRRLPRTTGLPTLSPTAARAPYTLAEIPIAHLPGDDRGSSNDGYAHHINNILYGNRRGRRARTRAVDIDEGGRRGLGDRNVERDYIDEHDDNESCDGLPAYDKHGGPPVYVEVLGVRAAYIGAQERSTPAAEPPSYPLPSTSQMNSVPATNQPDSESLSNTETASRTPSRPRSNHRSQMSAFSGRPPMMPASLSNW